VAGGADETEPDATTDTQATDVVDEPVESDDEQTEDVAESHSVEEIKGIGPTYAERLEAAGIGTVADLAASDATTVAEAAETGENRAGDWVERAQDF
jgi:polyhydroxyalkanoate synthase